MEETDPERILDLKCTSLKALYFEDNIRIL